MATDFIHLGADLVQGEVEGEEWQKVLKVINKRRRNNSQRKASLLRRGRMVG